MSHKGLWSSNYFVLRAATKTVSQSSCCLFPWKLGENWVSWAWASSQLENTPQSSAWDGCQLPWPRTALSRSCHVSGSPGPHSCSVALCQVVPTWWLWFGVPVADTQFGATLLLPGQHVPSSASSAWKHNLSVSILPGEAALCN